MQLLDKHGRRRAYGLMYRQLILYRRHLDRKFEIFFWPTVDALLFGAIGTYAARSGSSTTVALLLAGFVMAQVVWQAHIHLSKFFMQETWDKNVLYMMTRPLRTNEVFTAALGLTLTITLVAAAFIACAVALVFKLDLLRIPPGVVVLVPILMVLGWSTGLLATSLIVRMGQKADNFVWAIYGLIGPLSGSIVPVSNLPGGLRELALALPTTHAYEAGRAILFHHAFPVTELALAGFGGLAMLGGSALVMAKTMTTFRRRGFISRYV